MNGSAAGDSGLKYCLPLTLASQQEVLDAIERYEADFHAFEVWLDYLDQIGPAFATQLAEKLGPRLIALFRRRGLEPILLPVERRLEIMQALAGTGAYVDLDIATQEDEVAFLHSQKLALPAILSYHNYEVTPPLTKLEELSEQMQAKRAAICKFATYCNSLQDALQLLQFQQSLLVKGVAAIVIGMGPHGTVTRIFGSLWGNALVFAPVEAGSASAPGQLTRADLDVVFNVLRKSSYAGK